MSKNSRRTLFISVLHIILISFVFCYLPRSVAWSQTGDSWTTKAPMAVGRYLLTSSAVNGKIYAIGGQEDGTGAIVGTVEEYDPSTNTWATKNSMPTPRAILTSSAINGKIYVFGGDTVPGQVSSRSNIVEEYNPATDTWVTKSPMITKRSWACSSSANGKIYVIGGADINGNAINLIEEYDPLANTWTAKTLMLNARAAPACSTVNGLIYVIGGSVGPTDLNSMEAYDPSDNIWVSKTSMPTARSQLTSSEAGGKIYAIGGGNSSGFLTTNEEYDFLTNSWATRSPMLTLRGGLTSSAVNGKIYAIGGGNNTGFLTINEEYTTAGNGTSPPPPPGNQFPIAKAGPDRAAKSGEVIFFNCAGSVDPDGAIVSHEWNFGDGQKANACVTSHRFTGKMEGSKTYQVTLTVIDNEGAIGSDIAEVTISPREIKAEIFHPGDPPPCVAQFCGKLARMTAFYSWVSQTGGQDRFIVWKINFEGQTYLSYTLSVLDFHSLAIRSIQIPIPIWSQLLLGSNSRTFLPADFPRRALVLGGDEYFEGLDVRSFDAINIEAFGLREIGRRVVPTFETASAAFE